MESLKDTTTGKDLFQSIVNSITSSGLNLINLKVLQQMMLLSLVNILA